MKERPILFSSEMVRAILEGRKTQTRRILTKQPADVLPMRGDKAGKLWVTLRERLPDIDDQHGDMIRCKYGVAGDRLWVRETFVLEHWEDEPEKLPTDRPIFHHIPENLLNEYDDEYWMIPHYKATDPAPDLYYGDIDENDDGEPKCKWRPSIFMPRWVSRINLEITNVRCERLQAISPADAFAEGVRDNYLHQRPDWMDVDRYHELWDKLNAKRGFGWDSNPWVWVIEFKLIDKIPF